MRFVDVDRLTDGFPFNNMESAHEKDEPNCPFCFVVSLYNNLLELHNCTVIHNEVCSCATLLPVCPLPAVQGKKIMKEETCLAATPDHGMLTSTTSATRHSHSDSTSLLPKELPHQKLELETGTESDLEGLEPLHKKPRLDIDTKPNHSSISPPPSEAFEPVRKKPKLDIDTEHSVGSTSPPPSEDFEPVQKKPKHDINTEHSVGSASQPQIEVSQKTPFGCGCGKCTFFSFIESGCPTPIPSTSDFPYLDLSGLDNEQQQLLKGKLRSESQEIMIQFQELVSATIKSLIKQNVSLDLLVSHVMALGTFDPVFKEPQVTVFHHCFKELKAADTIPKVFIVLNDYFSFFNYQVIEYIVKELGTEEDKAVLQRYKENFNQYAKRRIFESLPKLGPVSGTDHADIFVKLDSQFDSYTVAEVEQFRRKLSKIFCVSSQGILRLCRIDRGCFKLMFQVPSFVQQEIFPLSKEQEKDLADVGVIWLTCGEYEFLVRLSVFLSLHYTFTVLRL